MKGQSTHIQKCIGQVQDQNVNQIIEKRSAHCCSPFIKKKDKSGTISVKDLLQANTHVTETLPLFTFFLIKVEQQCADLLSIIVGDCSTNASSLKVLTTSAL